MKTPVLILLFLSASLFAADVPRPFPPEYLPRRAAAEQAGNTLVDDMGAAIMALQAQLASVTQLQAEVAALKAERNTLQAQVTALTQERNAALTARDAALTQIVEARAQVLRDLESWLVQWKTP